VSFTDRTQTCRDCGQPFAFTEGGQEFFAQQGFTNELRRCPECRAANKARRGGGGGMAYGSDRDYSGGGGLSRGPREMFQAGCSVCGGVARVPFQPSGDKPVYCSNCLIVAGATGRNLVGQTASMREAGSPPPAVGGAWSPSDAAAPDHGAGV
jgi:CxxC-x17-CxxC domain-containing protein